MSRDLWHGTACTAFKPVLPTTHNVVRIEKKFINYRHATMSGQGSLVVQCRGKTTISEMTIERVLMVDYYLPDCVAHRMRANQLASISFDV